MNSFEVNKIQSKDENVCKYIFTTRNAVAESVLYKYNSYEERTVICCSTQSGCPIGCRFCGAGEYFARSLTSDEICDQVHYLISEKKINTEKIKRFQIMFMSMGEPLLNWTNVKNAIVKLNQRYPTAKLLISTSAPKVEFNSLNDLAIDIENIGLQFSIHESTDELRNKLIPFPNKYSLFEISEIGKYFFTTTGRKPFFNYCVHENNNSNEDAERLFNLFDPRIWEATISVICEKDESISASHKKNEKLSIDFMQLLIERGYSVRRFNPAGQDDIGGGCGQLWFTQQWFKNNNNFANPSIGSREAMKCANVHQI